MNNYDWSTEVADQIPTATVLPAGTYPNHLFNLIPHSYFDEPPKNLMYF